MKNQTFNKKIPRLFILFFWAAIFFIGMVILIKYFLITFAGLYELVLHWIKLTLNEEKVANLPIFQIIVISKALSLLFSSGFIFIISSAFSTTLTHIFYEFCTKNYKRINYPLREAITKGVKWSFYRNFLVLAPPVSVIMAGSLLSLFFIVMFNLLMKFAGISITLTSFIMSFISFSLIFLFIFSLFISLWQLVSTLFGAEIAISEPKLENKIIEKRSKNLILSKRNNLYICLGYLVFIYSVFIQIKYILTSSLIVIPQSQWFLNFIIIGDLICFSVFEYFKSSAYIGSLLEHSERISKSSLRTLKS